MLCADNPRGGDDDEGGKLDGIEKDAEGHDGEYGFIFDIVLFLLVNSPELIFGLGELFFGVSEEEGEYGYSKYPYYYNDDGLYSNSSTFSRAGKIKLSYLHESINLHAYEFETTIYPAKFMSFDISAKSYGEVYGINNRVLLIADFFVNWQRVRYNEFDLRWGLGAKYLEGQNQNFGLAYNIAFDIYAMNPVSLNFQYTGAFINNSYMNDLNIDLNLHSRNINFFIGYDYFGSESVSINAVKVGAGINF